MIKSFKFKNYKAFKEGGIELKPITILLGANSVGKSSILQFLSMIKQTINFDRNGDKNYQSALKLNGEYVSLGEGRNIFHNHKIGSDLEISLEIEKFNIQRTKFHLEARIDEVLFGLERILYSLTKNEERSFRNYRIYKNKEYEDLLKEAEKIRRKINRVIKNDKSLLSKRLFRRYSLRSANGKSKFFFYSESENKVILDTNNFKKIYTFVETLSNLKSKSVTLSYSVFFQKKELKVRRIEISSGKQILLSYEKKARKHALFSSFCDQKILDFHRSKFGRSVYFERLDIFPSKEEDEDDLILMPKRKKERFGGNVFVEGLFEIFKESIYEMKRNLSADSFNHVSPLRAFPRRYYFLDESNVSSSLNTIDGNQLTEVLKENKKVKGLVNSWLKRFELRAGVEKVADVIHNIKINQNGLNLDITDVGFGLSQVLPVIVQGFLSKRSSLTIIEQPEIHLHPKMQAELADLFIDIIAEDKNYVEKMNKLQSKKLLIETHSEYLLKRLRRRISENRISHKDVAIYFVHPKNEKTKSGRIEKIAISKTGNFKWPKDFYCTDLEDTIEFLKHQK